MKFAILCASVSMSVLFSHDGCDRKPVKDRIYEVGHLCASITTLPFSGLYHDAVDGDRFTFHRIGIGPCESGQARAMFGVNGELIELFDGRRVPLILGSMPREQWHLSRLRSAFKLAQKDMIQVHTLNRPYELIHTGAARLLTQDDPSVRLNLYCTTDDCAPSMANFLRIIKALRERDKEGGQLAYVHCLAGRGRSATAVAGYLYTILRDIGPRLPDIDVMERYLQSQRLQVRFKPLQRIFLEEFRQKLRTKKVSQLFADYETAMIEQERDSVFEREVLKDARQSIYTIFLSQVGFTMLVLALFVSLFS